MKKEYIEPSIEIINVQTNNVLEASKVFGGDFAGEIEQEFFGEE